MIKKTVFVLGGLGLLAAAGMAFAQTASTTTTVSPPVIVAPRQPMVLQVGPAGRVLLRGTIASVASSSLTVNSWGGTWTVVFRPNAEVLPIDRPGTNIEYKDGDFVGVMGTVSQSASWTVDATLVRDWTYRQAIQSKARKTAIITIFDGIIQNETPKNYQGTAGSVSGSSMPFGIGGTSYTVNVAPGAKIVNRNWLTIPLSSILNGDTVRVWGPNASGTITAEVVRDISIPAAGTSSAQEQLQGAPRH